MHFNEQKHVNRDKSSCIHSCSLGWFDPSATCVGVVRTHFSATHQQGATCILHMPIFKPDELERLAIQVFEAASVPSGEAKIVARHLVDANLGGHDSHGIMRVSQYVQAINKGNVKPGAKALTLKESPCTALLDGQNGFGQVVASNAVNIAIEKARNHGVAAVSFCNAYHTGRIATYTLMAANAGFAAMAMVNAGGGGQSVAPFGGLARRLATNPFSIATPSGNSHPLVLDIATSVAPEGKVRDYKLKKKTLPDGWIIDSKGKPSNDPNDFYNEPGGALLPFGGLAGYKGFGLGFMVDVLAGALSGAGCCRAGVTDPKDGLFLIVIDVEKFCAREEFYAHVQGLMEHVHSCPVAPGHKRVYIPGEIEHLAELNRHEEGIFIDDSTWGEICNTMTGLGLDSSGNSLFDAPPQRRFSAVAFIN